MYMRSSLVGEEEISDVREIIYERQLGEVKR